MDNRKTKLDWIPATPSRTSFRLDENSSFEELMRASYDEIGLAGSPLRLPAWLRRRTAHLVGDRPKLFSYLFFALHRLWAPGGPFQNNETARFWCELAGAFHSSTTPLLRAGDSGTKRLSCRRCPRTFEILESLPRLEREFILFSTLAPRSRIIPHVGALNGILRFHLPLKVPDGCGLRVGGVTSEWEEGKVLVFDDSFVHEVWNDSDETRIVLFLNCWHPALSDQETRALATLQEAYNGLPGGKRWREAQLDTRES